MSMLSSRSRIPIFHAVFLVGTVLALRLVPLLAETRGSLLLWRLSEHLCHRLLLARQQRSARRTFLSIAECIRPWCGSMGWDIWTWLFWDFGLGRARV